MELNKLTLSDFVSLVDIMWLDTVENVDRSTYNSGIFHVLTIASNSGDSRRFSEIQREQYATRKPEGEQGDRLRVQQGYTKDMTSYRVAKDVGVTYEQRTQNKYPEVLASLEDMTDLPFNTMELDLSMRISYATATSYTDMDGNTIDTATGDTYCWAYSGHKVKASSSTYRNILANNPRLSKGAMQAMLRMAQENAIDQFGKKIVGINYDILWTTDDPEDCDLVSEHLESTADPESPNSGTKNVNRYRYRHVRLTRVALSASGAVDTDKRHYWGFCSSKYVTAYLGIWESPHVIPMYELKDGSDNYQTGVRAGYGIVVVSGRGFTLSKGDGSA
jgi:hypothetical protein